MSGTVNAGDLQAADQSEAQIRAGQLPVTEAFVLTEKHYAFEGDVDENPGTVIIAVMPAHGDDRFLNVGGEIIHALPVTGKDRWERRRNIAKVVGAEAAKHGLVSSFVKLDFDGIFESRYVFSKR